MTTNEAQANLDTILDIMTIFDTHTLVLFDFGTSKSFVSSSFALHTDWELSPLKNKLAVITPLGEHILRTSVFKGCEVLVKGVVLKANLIPLKMYDFDMIMGMDWLSNHRALMDCFTKKIMFKKSRYLDLKFKGDKRILPTCVISVLEAKWLLHKGCEAYLSIWLISQLRK